MNERFSDEDLRAAYGAGTRSARQAHGPDCPSPDALLAALRGEGNEEERLRILDHALQCAACRPELALLHSVSTEGASSASAGRVPFAWRRFVPLAAAASIVLVGLVVMNQFFNQPDNVMRGGTSDVALIAPANNATLATTSANFVWHPVPGAIRYTLEVTTPDGTVLASQETRDTSVVTNINAATATDARWWVKAAMDDGSEKRSDPRPLRIKTP